MKSTSHHTLNDITNVLKEAGYGVVEGKENVKRKINEIAGLPKQQTENYLLEGHRRGYW